jgi:hypothetical protein
MTSSERIYYYPPDDFEEYCRGRLEKELEINQAGIDVILRMRGQILSLPEQLRQMEMELVSHRVGMESRLGRFQVGYIEAYWRELGSPPEENPEG